MPAAYPIEAEVQAALTAAGVNYGTVDLEVYLNAAVTEFESRTGWSPFLADAEDSTWWFDAPRYADGILDLEGGFTVITSVTVGAHQGNTGRALTVTNDFAPMSYNGPGEFRPWNRIRFLTSCGYQPRSIKVIGKRGACATVPDDVFLAIRDYAGALAMPSITQALGAVTKVKQGPVEYTMGNSDEDSGTSRVGAWTNAFDSAVSRYERML
jgi:hypothetical protein